MENGKGNGINRKVINFVVPVVMLLVIAVTIVLGTFVTWEVTLERMKTYLREQTEVQTETLQDKIDSKYALLTGLATSFSKQDAENPEDIVQKLEFCADKTEFAAVMFADATGHAHSNRGTQLEIGDRWYFEQCMKGKNAIERIKVGRLLEEPHFAVAVPVVWQDEVIGVLVGDYEDDMFQRLFAQVADSDICEESYICSSDGDIISAINHADAAKKHGYQKLWQAGDNIYELLDEVTGDTVESTYLRSMAGNIKVSGQLSYASSGEMRYAMFEQMKLNNWYILTILSQDRIDNEVRASLKISYLMLGIVLLGIAGTVTYLLVQNKKEDAQIKKEAEQLRYILEHDDLTGLLEEKTFQRKVAELLRDASAEQYCIVYMDVYKFKLINESFGYEKGDALLKVIAEEIKSFTSEHNGLCGRISGDKFVMYLPNQPEIVDQLYTRKIRENRLFQIDVYVHFGVYIIKNPQMSVAAMIDCAQLAQKLVKGDYDNYVSFYDDTLKQKILKEQAIVNSMVEALQNGEFQIYLQPQYNYRDGSISGAEALVRWISPTKGIISPGDFIPIFETNGFIVKLDENVWEQACRLIRQWIDEGRKPFPLSINVSRTDLLRGSVADKLKALIDKYELTPELLHVEITESAYMDNPQQLIMEIQKIREYGFLVEMDDFGSGYSSLNMLKDVPINVLKTDLKFLDTEGIESRRDQILDSVIRMAHQIGLSVVAEGVETKEQADYLVKLDCEIMQGYYFSKPVPIQQFEQMAYGNAAQ